MATSRTLAKPHSVRKSLLGMLMGNYVVNGKIDLHKTEKQIGLDDIWPFLPIEESATLTDLIQSRSGIYLDADPWAKRGANAPGTVMHNNNWDFNAAGTAFEKLTGRDIFDAFESDFARVLVDKIPDTIATVQDRGQFHGAEASGVEISTINRTRRGARDW